MRFESLIVLLIAAAVIYLPLIIIFIFIRRPFADLLAIGGLATVLCILVNIVFPPVGLILFLAGHTFGLYLWITNAMTKKPDMDDSLPPGPEELEED